MQRYLRANTEFSGLSDFPRVRAAGDYPGKDFFGQMTSLMNMFTVLALLSALVLIANTMTTLVAEQRNEIGVMKAIGGTRRQIRRVYHRTALLLGAAGSVLGVGLGLLIANAIVRFFGTRYFAITPPFGVVGSVVAASVVIGLLAPPLAALVAVRRGCPRSRSGRRCRTRRLRADHAGSSVRSAGSAFCRAPHKSASAA